MVDTFNDRQWRNLLSDIEDHRVVPIVGSELLLVEDGGQPCTLYQYLARGLASRFNIDPKTLSDDYKILDVCSQVLQNPSIQLDDLHYEARDLLRNRSWATPEPLKKLAAITDLDLFVLTTVDGLMQQALNEVRFNGRNETSVFTYSTRTRTEDISDSSISLKTAGSSKTTVFHLFGKMNPVGDYAITEDEVLEFSHRLQASDSRPQNLFDALRTRTILFLGCSFPGWLTRFLLRATKGDQLLVSGARGVVADRSSRLDEGFVHFLERRKIGVYFAGDAAAFVDDLHVRWMELYSKRKPPAVSTVPQTDEPCDDKIQPPFIFISYAREDVAVAKQLKSAFDQAGLRSWYDNQTLVSGDDFRLQITDNIEKCSCFVPIISKHTASLDKRFFQREWNQAIDELKSYPEGRRFILPLMADETPIDAPGVPREFRAYHFRRLDDLTQLVDDAKSSIRAFQREVARQ